MPTTRFKTPEKYRYQSGLGSYLESEAIDGILPIAQQTPQAPACGLYTERISGSAFVAPRHENLQTWLLKGVPSANHEPFQPEPEELTAQSRLDQPLTFTPSQVRWDPFEFNDSADWTTSMRLLAGAGNIALRRGMSYFVFAAGQSMDPQTAYTSADGDLLIIVQHGVLDIRTELGHMLVRPEEICMIPRGIRYQVMLPEGRVRGHAVELHEGHWTLPDLGIIGSFGLANARDFQIPVASFDPPDVSSSTTYKIISKFNGRFHTAKQPHNPFDVAGWHGTYYPFKYDLGRFMTMGSIAYDHPDPSIFTVLCSTVPGMCDVAAFPPRWMVIDNSFRPPWYHRNTMIELMGLISGEYDARPGAGFQAGGASLHTVMAPHGPDAATHAKASSSELKPTRIDGGMAFLIESSMMLGLSEWAAKTRQPDYNATTWAGLKSHFKLPEGAVIKSPLLDADLKSSSKLKDFEVTPDEVGVKAKKVKGPTNGHAHEVEAITNGHKETVVIATNDPEISHLQPEPQPGFKGVNKTAEIVV